MKSCIDFYDDSATMWADNWYNNQSLLPYLKKFLGCIDCIEPRILDLCCGAGYESMRLKSLGAQVVGADLSTKSLEIAKAKNPEIEFYVKDMLKNYSDLGKFDGIVCIAGIVHLQGDQLGIAFKNMAEVLREKGFLLLVYKEGEKLQETSVYNNEVYKRNFVYHTQEELKKYMPEFALYEDISSEDGWKYQIYIKLI